MKKKKSSINMDGSKVVGFSCSVQEIAKNVLLFPRAHLEVLKILNLLIFPKSTLKTEREGGRERERERGVEHFSFLNLDNYAVSPPRQREHFKHALTHVHLNKVEFIWE